MYSDAVDALIKFQLHSQPDVLPEFVPLLHRNQVVLPDTFGSRSTRQRRALDIVSDATQRRRPAP